MFHGGRNVVLIAISTDSPEDLAAWARDDEFPFLLASDEGAKVGKAYGAMVEGATVPMDNRSLLVVDAQGRIAYVAAPFEEDDPKAYEELGEAVDRIAAPE